MTEANGALSLKWKASDDYGVAGMEARFELSDVQDGEMGIAGNGVFLFDPPEFPIALKRAAPKEATGTAGQRPDRASLGGLYRRHAA